MSFKENSPIARKTLTFQLPNEKLPLKTPDASVHFQGVQDFQIKPIQKQNDSNLPLIKPISIKPLGYSKVIYEIFSNSAYKQMFEGFNFEILPAIFLENGTFKLTLMRCQKKNPGQLGMQFNKYDDTFAKMKIFVSRNLCDLKNAYMYYYSVKNIHYHTHYNEFVENLNNAIIYKESLRSVDSIQLIDVGTDNFYFKQVKITQEMFDMNCQIFKKALFCHKYNFYKYVRGILINSDMENEFICTEKSFKGEKDKLMRFVSFRVALMVQSIFRLKIKNCECRFLISEKGTVFSVIHRIVFLNEEFKEDLLDEEEFEAISTEKTSVGQTSFNRSKNFDFSQSDQLNTIEVSQCKYTKVTAPLVEMTTKYLEDITLEFQNIKTEFNESDRAFEILFPDSTYKLSQLIEIESKKTFMENYVKQMRKQYSKKVFQ